LLVAAVARATSVRGAVSCDSLLTASPCSGCLLTVVVGGVSRLLIERKLLLNSTTHDLRAVDSRLSAAALVAILRELYSRSISLWADTT
jgi:hypothetical protein